MGAGGVWEVRRREMHAGFWWGTQRERDHWEHPGVDGRIILTGILRQQAPRIGNAFIWLRREN